MKIEGTFKTKSDETIKVSIYNKGVGGANININTSDDIRFAGDEPVIITQQQDDTFEHILYTQCKISLVTKRWLGDYLFASNYSSIVVNVWRNNDCVFCGYVTPRSYNQAYSHVWETVEVNCVDILSTLKDRRLTDSVTYEELVAQSTTRPFSWFLGNMDLDTTTVVIPNFPDIDYEEAEFAWYEVNWTRNVLQDNEIEYYGIEAEVVILDDDTAMNTGNERQGELKTVTWIESTDTCIVDGVSYYKEYAHITVAGEDVNTGDWRIGSNAGGMPVVVDTENRIDGWTTGVLPQPFDFYEHYTTYNIYDNGMEMAGSDGIGDQIPEYPSTTTNGSYYEFIQGSSDDLDYDEDTQTYYYKEYAWVTVNSETENSGQWQRGQEQSHVTGTTTELTGWMFDTPAVPFEYYEKISHYNVFSDSHQEWTYDTMGHSIPLYPSTTTNGSYYEFRQGEPDDLYYDSVTNKYYFKEYAWVTVNNVAENSGNWRRGNEYTQYYSQYLTIEPIEAGDIMIKLNNLTSNDLTYVGYSTDLETWNNTYCDGTTKTITIPVNSGDKIYLKGEGKRYITSTNITTYDDRIIYSNCSYKVYGNIMSLLYGDDFADKISFPSTEKYAFAKLFINNNNYLRDISNLILPATTLAQNCYQMMFFKCTAITSTPSLYSTTLAIECYESMFEHCSSLVNAPALPATTLTGACYRFMFDDCTSLVNAPELPATTLAVGCYGEMFAECTSLTTAPALPATTLTYGCYNAMFIECSSLVNAPALPATTLASECYSNMFGYCSSLVNAPELPATTLAYACYYYMFNQCTSLVNAPDLHATTLADNCYKGMFNGCTNLSSITMLATDISASDCLYNWVNGVAASGTFTKASSMTTLPTGNSGIPSGWTVVDAA